MSEVDKLKKLVTVLTNQRNFAFDQLAQLEAIMLAERETHANHSNDKSSGVPPSADAEAVSGGPSRND